MDEMEKNREYMKCPNLAANMSQSDQQRGVAMPPVNIQTTGELIVLPPFDGVISNPLYADLLDTRRSERLYADAPVSREQLAFLLWSAQGIQARRGGENGPVLRTIPSGGSRHPFETYVVVNNVVDLNPGLYRYAPNVFTGEKRVAVEYLGAFTGGFARLADMLSGQVWAAGAPIILFISCVPYRSEWRYSTAAHRVMLIDLGHVGQNVMLSAVAAGLGSCCIAAYNQDSCDDALGFNGTDEYTVYAISVGAPKRK